MKSGGSILDIPKGAVSPIFLSLPEQNQRGLPAVGQKRKKESRAVLQSNYSDSVSLS
jgi:hypothetical protein